MGMFTQVSPPALPAAPAEYDVRYMQQLMGILRLFFSKISAVQGLNLATLNLNLDTLPTEADVATLREGDVYRDTTDGVLRTADGGLVGAGARSNKVLLWLSM